MNDGILVVPDNAVKPQQVRNMGLSADYRADTKEERYSIETQLDNLMKNISFKKRVPDTLFWLLFPILLYL